MKGVEGKKPRPAAHAGCSCCVFVLDSAPLPAPQPSLSIVQQVMGVGPPEVASLHAHVQGEFNRCVCGCVCVCECMCEVCVQMFFDSILMHPIRRAGTASRLGRLQAQTFYTSHQQFTQNKQPVNPHHISCIKHLVDSGRVKSEAAAPATLALLLQTPSKPAHIMRPFRFGLFHIFFLHSQQRKQGGSRRI